MSSLIGPIIGADDIGDAVMAHLQTWMPTYLAEIARQRGLPSDTFPKVETWDLQAAGQRMPEWIAPAIAVTPLAFDEIHGGQNDTQQPTLDGGQLVQVSDYVESTSNAGAFRLSARYIAAVRACLLQHPTLGGFATAVEWVTETYRGVTVDPGESRFRGGASVVVRVHVPGLVRVVRTDLPAAPGADPTAPPPEPPLHMSSHVVVDQKR